MKLGRLGCPLRLTLAIGVLSTVVLGESVQSVHADALAIPVPCALPSPSPSGPPAAFSAFRSCDQVLNGAPAIAPNAGFPGMPALPGLTTVIYNRIHHQSDCAYEGIDLDPSQNAGGGKCAGQGFGHPCSLVSLPFYKNSAEATSDHLNKSCGNPVKIQVKPDNCAAPTAPEQQNLAQILSGPPFNLNVQALEAMDPAALEKLFEDLTKHHPVLLQNTAATKSNCIYMNTTFPNGEREMSWIRGAYVQALAYFTSTVLNEMSCGKSITIDNDPTVNGCASFGKDYATQYATTQNAAATLSALLGAQAGVRDIDFCKADWDPGPTNRSVDPGQIRQAAQHLCSARAYLENMFAQIAVCDIFNQTRHDFNAKIGLSAAQQNVFLITEIAQKRIKPLCSQCRNSDSYSQATDCTQKCWNDHAQSVLTQMFHDWWPVDASNSCGSGGSTPFNFPVLALSLIGFRRRKRSLAACLGLALVIFGCSKAKNLPQLAANDPNNTCPGKPPACCGSSPPASCPNDNPGLGALTSSLASGAGFAAGSAGENALASTFDSGANTAGTGKFASAATAGGTAGTGTGQDASGPSGSPIAGLLAAVKRMNSSGASASGGSIPGGSGGLLAGDVTTQPAPRASPGGNPSAGVAGATESGGGGSGYASKGSTGGFLYGNGLVEQSGLSGASGENDFKNGHEVPAMAGQDPANYFTMIGMDESLFKKVENRYRVTSMNWASSNAGSALAAAPTVQVKPQK